MPLSEKDQKLIERYIQQRLTPEEQSTFQQRMQDSDFQEEVEDYEEMQSALQSMQYQQLKSRFVALDETLQVQQTAQVKRFQVIGTTFAIMAATILFFVIRNFNSDTLPPSESPEIHNAEIHNEEIQEPTDTAPATFRKTPATSPPAAAQEPRNKPVAKNSIKITTKEAEELFATHFEPYRYVESTNSSNRRGGKESQQINSIHDFFILYKNESYSEALLSLDTVSTDSLRLQNWKFFQANALLQTGQTDQAISLFEELLKVDHSMFLDQSYWYLALAYLQKNDIPQTRHYLDLLLKSKSGYKETPAMELRAKVSES